MISLLIACAYFTKDLTPYVLIDSFNVNYLSTVQTFPKIFAASLVSCETDLIFEVDVAFTTCYTLVFQDAGWGNSQTRSTNITAPVSYSMIIWCMTGFTIVVTGERTSQARYYIVVTVMIEKINFQVSFRVLALKVNISSFGVIIVHSYLVFF